MSAAATARATETVPMRIRLSRARGWRMPLNTVKVDRTTPWGNPFIVGEQGSQAECVYWFILLIGGYLCVSRGAACADRQRVAMKRLKAERSAGFAHLRGRHLACWCELGKPCHADVLLDIANRADGDRQFDLDAFMARYGWRFVDGKAQRIS